MIMYLCEAILAFCLTVFGSCHADNGKLHKSFQKESKKMYKELKSGGWKVYGNTLPLDVAIEQYYQKLYDGNGGLQPLQGEAIANNENLALRKAQHQATSQLAAQQETHVSSEMNMQVTNIVSDEVKSQTTFDKTIQANVDKNVKSLRPELTLIRHKDNGQVEVRMLFLVKIE